MKLEKAVGHKVIIFTKKDFRFEGVVIEFDGKFIEIHDEKKNKPKMINIDEIAEWDLVS